MLTNFNRSLSISASSSVETPSGEKIVVSYMSANVNNAGGFTVNQSIQSMEDYIANEDTVNADFAEFQSRALAISKQYKETEV